MSVESQPLLQHQTILQKVNAKMCIYGHLCLPSKAAILVIMWTAMVGTIYSLATTLTAVNNLDGPHHYKTHIETSVSLLYVYLALIMLVYPISGFIADVRCGRYKVITVSLCFMTTSTVLFCTIAFSLSGKFDKRFYDSLLRDDIPLVVLVIIVIILFTVGIIGYQANFIQFGLDQLREAKTEHVGLFVHYNALAFNIGASLSVLFVETGLRNSPLQRHNSQLLLGFLSSLLAVASLLLLLLSCRMRHWFYVQPGQQSPYRIFCKILNFARKNKYPLQRSAFTYCDDCTLSRIDFAKERYGGPYTTEQVENVKTLLRILLLLVSLGPVFVLQVPASVYVFPLFGYHIGFQYAKEEALLKAVEDGVLIQLTTNILFPVYILYLYVYRRNRIPKMFTRLKLGIFVSLLGVTSMLIIDVIGHSINMSPPVNHTESQCLFFVNSIAYAQTSQPLKMPWYVLIPPSMLLGIGSLVVTTTTLEFISAQSPHSMTGVLVGVFFAIQGIFQLLGYMTTLPFSVSYLWVNKTFPAFVSCGSVYLLLTTAVGLIGFGLFCLTAKYYKYRKRDDNNFNQADVEEVFTRYLSQTASTNSNENSIDD